MAVFNLSASNLLVAQGFVDAAFPPGRILEVVSQPISFQQSIQVVNLSQEVTSTLAISQSVTLNKTVQLNASNTLPMYSQGAKVRFISVSSLLQLSHSAKKVLPEAVSSSLTFQQEVNVHRGLQNQLTFIQSVNCNIVKILSVSSQLTIVAGAVGIIDGNWQFVAITQSPLIADYDPSNLSIPPVPATPYPTVFVGNGNTLSFTNVDYGDSDRIEHTRISRRTLGHELIVFRDSRWPKTETLKFKLIDITAAQGKSMLNFMESTLAQAISVTDRLGVRWLGVITNPETMVMQPSRANRYSLEIEFQGTQSSYILSRSVSNALNLTSSVDAILTGDLDRDVFSSLTFTGTVIGNRVLPRSASDSLVFVGTALGSLVFPRSASNNLTFTGTAFGSLVLPRSTSNSLTFTGTASNVAIFSRSVSNVLTFIGTVSSNQVFNRDSSNSLVLLQSTIVSRVHSEGVDSTLTFVDFANSNSVFNRDSSNTLVFTGTASSNQVFNRSLTSTLTFTQSAIDELVSNSNSILHEVSGNVLLEDATNILLE